MTRFLKTGLVIGGLVLISLTTSFSQRLAAAEAADPQYIDVLKGRAGKIVSALDINDPEKKTRVQDLIVMQYYNLSQIHDSRDARIEVLKKEDTQNDQSLDRKIEAITKRAEKDIKKLHKRYITQLSREVDTDQVDKIKDGMTYGVVPITFRGYLRLLPDLTDVQKKKIRDYLLEARELAMDAGSSEEKHHVFGQYKGKINNYLSAGGYDLKEAERALKERNKSK